MKYIIFTCTALLYLNPINAATDRWQQEVDYTMNINLDVETNRITGDQKLIYTNNSPDTLNRMFYHLYFNAFQPGSMMDVRSRTISDPDGRVKDRISKLKKDEIGFQEIDRLTMNGADCKYNIEGTILEVDLPSPILPGEAVTFEMKFNGQVPVQIRRSGRDNIEGIRYTMTQWYPKAVQYDFQGRHANPYVGREFYGIFGNFDVTINIDREYVVGGTGVLTEKRQNDSIASWRFKAENVHDFAWAADPDYQHDSLQAEDGLMLHFYYKTDTLAGQWKDIQPKVAELFRLMNRRFGEYPYPQFSVIQGGDGGMEYPMCTMILGHGTEKGKVGLIAHEAFHNWFYGVIATNEFKYPWMDEGFTSYAEKMIMDELYEENKLNPLERAYRNYRYMAGQPWEEPLATPADFYELNIAYGINSYSKGSVTLHQLSYVIGQDVFDRAMKRYYNTWKFKHPTPLDFRRIMEKESGMDLNWYFEHWLYTTHHIDYSIDTVLHERKSSTVKLKRNGAMPMPLDIAVTLQNGETHLYYVPLTIMRGIKKNETDHKRYVQNPNPWTHPEIAIEIPFGKKEIKEIEIDPSLRMADINLHDNKWFTDKELNKEYRTPKKEKDEK